MKAVVVRSYGGPEVFNIGETQEPKPRENQVLVEVRAAGVNPFDIHILSGIYKQKMPLAFPVTPGGDLAGIVREAGDGVMNVKPGDEVYGTAIVLSGGSGAIAEYASVNANKLSIKPMPATFVEAASLPVAGLTAAQAILDHAKIKKGMKILIHGGAGGVGHFAVQLAKSMDAYVASTAGKDDLVFVKSLGADEVIDYKSEDFSAMLKGFDAVLDIVGGEVNKKSYRVLSPGGVLVTTVGQSDAELEKKFNVMTIKQSTNTDTPALERLAKLVGEGKMKPHVDKVFSLDEAGKAFDMVKSGHPRGKVVIEIKK